MRRDRPRPGRDHPLDALTVPYDRPADTQDAIRAALDGGFSYIVLSLGAPYPVEAARWVADTFIAPAH